MARFAFFRNVGKKLIYIGWTTFRIGVSAGNCGGGIGFLYGIGKVVFGQTRKIGMYQPLLPRIFIIGSKMRMYSTPGHPLGFGP